MLQPPPRKVKPTSLLKDVQTEQTNRLQEREQQLLDIVEDIRQFSKQRSDLERSYGQALLKLTNQMLSKKELFNLADIKSDVGTQKRTVNSAWKKVLEETEKLAWQRIKAAEIYTNQVVEPSRVLKDNMTTVIKKAFEQLSTLHKDLAQTASDMAVAQKMFADDESTAMTARLKAADAEMRFKKRQTSLLTSQDTLQKNTAKFAMRRDVCNAKAVHSRNAYLLELAAANAHSIHHHDVDLPNLYAVLDEGMFEELSTFLQVLGKTEVDVCSAILQGYRGISDFASLVDRDYNLRCFIKSNEVFDIPMHFDYESVSSSEQVSKLSLDYQQQTQLVKEARQWAAKQTSELRLVQELSCVAASLPSATAEMRSLGRSLLSVNSAGKELKKGASNADDIDPEVSLENIRSRIQKAEVGRVKAEARLDLLRAAGINVDAALEQAHTTLSKAGKGGTIGTEAGTSDANNVEYDALSRRSVNGDNWSFDENDSFDSFSDYDESPDPSDETLPVGDNPPILYPYNVAAIYAYNAANADELTLVQGEILEIVHPGDGDGWLKAHNRQGHVGLVPGNYVEPIGDSDDAQSPAPGSSSPAAAKPAAGADALPLASKLSASDGCSLDGASSRPSADVVSVRSGSLYSATDYEVQQALTPKDSGVKADGVWLRALYDYSASCDEELSFAEGQLIHLISKVTAGGIDDGYWQGQMGDRFGVFPSLVVEELNRDEYPTIEQVRQLQGTSTSSAATTAVGLSKQAASAADSSKRSSVGGGNVMLGSAVHRLSGSLNAAPTALRSPVGETSLPLPLSSYICRPSTSDIDRRVEPLSCGMAADGAQLPAVAAISPTRPTPKQWSTSLISDRRSLVEAQLAAVTSRQPPARQRSDGGGVAEVGDFSAMTPVGGSGTGHGDPPRKPSVTRRPVSLGQPRAAEAVAMAVKTQPVAASDGGQAALASILQKSLGADDAKLAAGTISERRSRALVSHTISSKQQGGGSGSTSSHSASAATVHTGSQDDAALVQLRRQRSESGSRSATSSRPLSIATGLAVAGGRNWPLSQQQTAAADNLHNPSYRHAVSLSTSSTQQQLAGRWQETPRSSAAGGSVPRHQQFSTPQPLRKSRPPSGPARKESAV